MTSHVRKVCCFTKYAWTLCTNLSSCLTFLDAMWKGGEMHLASSPPPQLINQRTVCHSFLALEAHSHLAKNFITIGLTYTDWKFVCSFGKNWGVLVVFWLLMILWYTFHSLFTVLIIFLLVFSWFHFKKTHFKNNEETLKNYEKTIKKPSTVRKPPKNHQKPNFCHKGANFQLLTDCFG